MPTNLSYDEGPEESPKIKSGYEDYAPHYMWDPRDQDDIDSRKKRAYAANKRLAKTGDSRHPNTIRADIKRKKRNATEAWYNMPYSRTNEEGDVINPADYAACNMSSRNGSFSHGGSGCGCTGC